MTPFQRAEVPQHEIDRVMRSVVVQIRELGVEAYCEKWGFAAGTTPDQIIENAEGLARREVWLNDTYQVAVARMEPTAPGSSWPPMVHLSIKRIDKQTIHDWRDLQRIKSEIIGPDCEGVELYPSESRVVDTANQYHLWVFTTPGVKWPFGFAIGCRSEDLFDKSVQRPFEKVAGGGA